jgi:hypothetical protein
MIQLVFKSTGKITPEWEHDEERLAFRLAPGQVSASKLLHGRLDEANVVVPDAEPLGLIAARYAGDAPHELRVILELPDEVWDALAEQADRLLDNSA